MAFKFVKDFKLNNFSAVGPDGGGLPAGYAFLVTAAGDFLVTAAGDYLIAYVGG